VLFQVLRTVEIVETVGFGTRIEKGTRGVSRVSSVLPIHARLEGIEEQPKKKLTIVSQLETAGKTACAVIYSFTLRSRRALAITDTELKVMAALAIMGLSKTPKKGYKTPAASGMPMVL